MKTIARDVMLPGDSLHIQDRGVTLLKKLSSRTPALPVVNDDREVVGIVTKASIRSALREEATIFRCTAASLMRCGHLGHTHSCLTPLGVSPETPVADVLKTMFRERAEAVPVVQDRVLIGVINRNDLIVH